MTADFSDTPIDLAREHDFWIGDVLVRPSTRQVEVGGGYQILQPRIMQVLVALARRQDQVVSRDELTRTCWEGRVVGDDAINRCTQRIRKLGETSHAFELETIPRVGYRLRALKDATIPVAFATALPDASSVSRRTSVASPTSTSGLSVVVVLLLLVGGLATWWASRNSRTATVVPATTLAVLPFEAVDSDPLIQALANALPRDMADLFSRGGISVTAVAESMIYHGAAKARAATELDADIILDGTVKREGEQARVTVRLYHARRGVTLWSIELTADPRDPFIDDRLAAEAARSIYWTVPLRILNSDRPNAVEEARTFLRILQASNQGDQIGASEAAAKFALDAPDLINAHSAAAIETMQVIDRLSPGDRQKALAYSRREAEAALRIGPRDGSAYHAASVVVPRSKWEERIALMRKGIELDPRYTRLRANLAILLRGTGAIRGGLSIARQARAEEPLSPVRAAFMAEALLANGDVSEMERILDDHEQIWPDDRAAARLRLHVALWRGDPDEAASRLDKVAPVGSAEAASLQTMVAAALIVARRSGRADDIEYVAQLCSRIAQEVLLHPPAQTCLLAGGVLDRPDISFAAAEFLLPRIHDSPEGEDAWILVPEPDVHTHTYELFMPWMAPMRAAPRIVGVFERLGLLDYWKETGAWPDLCDAKTGEVAARSVCADMMSVQAR